MLLVRREAGARFDLPSRLGRCQRPAVGESHLPPRPLVSALFLSIVVHRAQVAFRGSRSTVQNAWCARVKGFLVQDGDLVVCRASASGSTCLPPPLHGCGPDQRAAVLPTWGSWKTRLLPVRAEFSFYGLAARAGGRTSRTPGLSFKCASSGADRSPASSGQLLQAGRSTGLLLKAVRSSSTACCPLALLCPRKAVPRRAFCTQMRPSRGCPSQRGGRLHLPLTPSRPAVFGKHPSVDPPWSII